MTHTHTHTFSYPLHTHTISQSPTRLHPHAKTPFSTPPQHSTFPKTFFASSDTHTPTSPPFLPLPVIWLARGLLSFAPLFCVIEYRSVCLGSAWSRRRGQLQGYRVCVSVRWGGVVVRHAPRLLPQQQQDGSEGCHGVQVVGSGGGSWRASVFLSECVFALIGVCVCVCLVRLY